LKNQEIDTQDNQSKVVSLTKNKTTKSIADFISYLPVGDNETEDNYRRALFRKWDQTRDSELSVSQVFLGLVSHLNPTDRKELKDTVTNAFDNLTAT
jgi:hypothetical protein